VKGKGGATAAVTASCLKCHNDRDKFVSKTHDAGVLGGNKSSALCIDCHGRHDVLTFALDDKGGEEKKIY